MLRITFIAEPPAVPQRLHLGAAPVPLATLVKALFAESTTRARRPHHCGGSFDDVSGSRGDNAVPRWAVHRDLDDVVREKFGGGRMTFYVGNNLARGDISGVKTFGFKFIL